MIKKPIRSHRYTLSNGQYIIEVSVRIPQQLFDVRDPAPFRERDLDEKFFRYLVSAAHDLPRGENFSILIHISEQPHDEFSADSIKEAIQRFLDYKEDQQNNELKKFVKQTEIFLVIGLIILFACLGLSDKISDQSPWGLSVLKEGLVVLGWVSIWKPIELMMYGWYPVYRKLKFYQRLEKADVEVRFPL